MKLILTNNLTKQEVIIDNLTDSGASKLFFNFTVELPEVEDGEYNYELYEKEELLASGLCQIGDYKPTPKTSYNNDTKYITYGE